jgi:hypothetical protein
MSDNQQTPAVPGIAVDVAAPTAQDAVAAAAVDALKNGKAVNVGPATPPPAGATVIQMPAGLMSAEFFAKQAESLGYHDEAARLRGKTGKPSIFESVKRVGQHRITVSDVVVYVGGAALLVAVYEGCAYYFEWDAPRIFSDRPTAAKASRK